MKIVSAAEMREIDRVTTERFEVASLTLMENAGSAVADFALRNFADAKQICVICGKGNNAGDGFVAARKLRDAGLQINVVLLANPEDLRGDAAEMFRRMRIEPTRATTNDELAKTREKLRGADLLIDAVLGTGFRPPVSGLYAQAIETMNAADVPVVAVDIPSGADADAMGPQSGAIARADAVITFTAPRPAHVFGELSEGPTIAVPIGSPDAAIVSTLQLNLITAQDVAKLIGPRPRDANKGSFGHVLVIGGSLGKAGAAAMAGMSALRAGAGLSTVATPKSVLATVAGFHPEIMTEPCEETESGSISLRALEYAHIDNLVKGKTVLAVGPGISRNEETSEFVRSILDRYSMPIVLDADGLNAFAGSVEKLNGKGRKLVITPHPGEMARLASLSIPQVQRDRIGVARNFSRDHQLIVVLKGHRTLIAEPGGEVWVNTTGNPGMATGGTGDVLTGVVAGMIAQNPERILEAVAAAVHLHGLAGDIGCETMGEHSLVATDLIRALPEAFARAREV